MQIRDIYTLGENVEIKDINQNPKISVLLYTKGKVLVTALSKKRNISLTKDQLYKIAGVKKITDDIEIQACCYSKAVYDEIQRKRMESNATIDTVSVARNYTEKLIKTPSSALISSNSSQCVMHAKRFTGNSPARQDMVLTKLMQHFEGLNINQEEGQA